MKQLEKEFTGTGDVKNVNFKQALESEKGYMYIRMDLEGQIYYEVFEKNASKYSERYIGTKLVKYDEKIKYPKSIDFGKWAWCFNDYKKALDKFNTL
jgi:hypothetical protein